MAEEVGTAILRHPSRLCVLGSSGSGKTWTVLRLIRDHHPGYNRILWVAPRFSLIQRAIAPLIEAGCISTHSGRVAFLAIPADPLEKKKAPRGKPKKGKAAAPARYDFDGCVEADEDPKHWTELLEEAISEGWKVGAKQLIVLDDLLSVDKDKAATNMLSRLFTAGRHQDLSVMELAQRAFDGADSRTHRVNCHHFILHQFGARDEARRLIQQLFPEDAKKLYVTYQELIEKDPHAMLWLDVTSHSHDGPMGPMLKWRTGPTTCLVLD